MQWMWTLVLFLTAISWHSKSSYAADLEQVAVGEDDQGQAFLVDRLGECFAVVPAHVIGDRCGANLTAAGTSPVLGHGILLLTSDPEITDLAILQISGPLKQSCGTDFASLRRNLQQPLQRRDLGVISTVDSAGGGAIIRIPVVIEDVQERFLWVSPRNSEIDLPKGTSGAILSVEDTAVGMVLSVHASFGAAKALRMDTLTTAIDPFFSTNVGHLDPLQMAEHCFEPSSDIPEELHKGAEIDVAAADNGGELVHWSVPLHDPEQNPQMILSGEESVVWEAVPSAYPIDFIVDLAGDKPAVIRRLEISTKDAPFLEAIPKHMELFASASAAGSSWHSIRPILILPSQPNVVEEIAPTRARRIMIRVHANYGHPSLLTLGRISIFTTVQ